ncbi:MAG: hypothetical protein WAU63_03020 [Methylovirgula sp.]
MRIMMLLFAVLSLVATPLYAAPRTIKDCEKIQAADAYNRCLASFGPVAHVHRLALVPAGVNRYTYAYRHRRRHTPVIVRQGRRKRMLVN